MSRQAHIGKRSLRKADRRSHPDLTASVTSKYPLLVVTALAAAVPFMWAYQQPPLSAFYSQVAAAALWLLTVLLAARTALQLNNSGWASVLLLWVGLLMLVVVHAVTGVSPLFVAAPIAFSLLLCGLVTWAAFAAERDAAIRLQWLGALLAGVLVAALFNSFVALLQTVAPNWTHETWIASSPAPHDRAGGNLRQPNQLATLSLWGLLAATFLLRRWPVLWFAACLPLLATLFATGSRTGVVSLALIVIAALLASTRVRAWRRRSWLLLVIAIVPLAWLAESVFTRSTADAALSQRLSLWRDVFELIRQHPWTGVGVGQLNFAWTLTPLAERAPDVFDHAHSLPLHLAVELGVPAALLVLGLLALVLWRARAAMRTRAGATVALMLAVILLHSLFEYPLWFSYFLLPSAFLLAWLVTAADTGDAARSADDGARRHVRSPIVPALVMTTAVGLLIALLWSVREYDKAAAIHRRVNSPAALNAAVDSARGSPLFGQYGDYAAIMLAGDAAPLAWFERPVRNVLDERLLVAYARALARAGDTERAAYVVARAREFPPNRLFDDLPAVTSSLVPTGAASAPHGPRDFRR